MPDEDHLSVQEERAQYGEEKPKAKDTARLIWASKPKKEPNAKDLEFQTAEEVYPNIADVKDKKLSRFWAETKDINDDPNRLIWGDNLLVMQALLANGYEGQIDLIYIDPPFNTGENFNFSTEISIGNKTFEKELPIHERLAYTDTWERDIDSFLDMLYPRLQLMNKLLSDKGSIYVHCDWHVSHYIRIIMDEVFGKENFRNEIVWQRDSAGKGAKGTSKQWSRENDTILLFFKSNNSYFKQVYREELTDTQLREYIYSDPDGRKFKKVQLGDYSKESIQKFREQNLIYVTSTGREYKKYYLDEAKFAIGSNWTDIINLSKGQYENIDYPTQKPEKLLQRIIQASCTENSIIADFFCGSGTTGAVAEKLGRRWIMSDLSKTAIQVTRGRLVHQNSKPFLIQNLGNYQRQLIYSKEIKLKEMYNIVLKLYGATPRTDWQGFGISKEDNKTLVFVCEPDRPMTGKKAVELAKSAKTADGKGYKRLIILAWDFEYDFDDTFQRLTKNSKKDLSEVDFKIIPSDVYKYLRSTKVGDQDLANKITFYEKPYLRLSEPQITKRDKEEAQIKLRIEQYVLRDIPVKDESKRPEIEKMLHKNFANLIDYWTVDWDYDGEVFRSKWQAIRDRKSSSPVQTTADTTLKRGKKYTIAVRVVDVFGNDASLTKEIDLR